MSTDAPDKTRKARKGPRRSFKTYLRLVLKKVHPEAGMSNNAAVCVDRWLAAVATRLPSIALRLTQDARKQTISAREVQTAVQTLLPGDLAKQAVTQATQAVTKFNTAQMEKKKGGKAQRRETMAGLQFSVSRLEKYLRNFGAVKLNVGGSAPVYLAAVVEYLCSELLELAGNVAQQNKRQRITVRHLFLVIANDSEFKRLSHDLNIVILGGGVLPHIHAELLKKAPAKRKKKTGKAEASQKGDQEGKKPHKWRAGTQAIRSIRKYQKSSALLTQKQPFERLVREIASQFGEGLRFGQLSVQILQFYAEHRLVQLLERANQFSIHAKRQTVEPVDIQLAVTAEQVHPRTPISSPTSKPSAPGFHRLAYRAGVKRITKSALTEVGQVLPRVLVDILQNAVLATQHRRAVTVSAEDVRSALESQGVWVTF